MAILEYTVEEIVNHKPKYERIENTLYVDGVPVRDWQLTPREVIRYMPDRYNELCREAAVYCPICEKELGDKTKRAVWNHLRDAHAPVYDQIKEQTESLPDYISVYLKVKEVQNAETGP